MQPRITSLENRTGLSRSQETDLAKQEFEQYMLAKGYRPVASRMVTTAPRPASPAVAAAVPLVVEPSPIAAPPSPPLAAARKPKRIPPECPGEEALANFFRVIDSIRDQAIFRLMYHAGLRASEIGLLALE